MVVVAFVVVPLVTVIPMMFATDALKVSATTDVKSASVEKSDVDVALVMLAFVATRFVVVAFSAIMPVEDAALNVIAPAVKLPLTARLPKRVLSPLTERSVASTEAPEREASEIEPPDIVGLPIVVLSRLSIALETAIVLGEPPPSWGATETP